MKLYLISQSQIIHCDAYDSAVVVAPDEEAARNTNPCTGGPMVSGDWENFNYWCSDPERVYVLYLGEAAPDIAPGVVCASFYDD